MRFAYRIACGVCVGVGLLAWVDSAAGKTSKKPAEKATGVKLVEPIVAAGAVDGSQRGVFTLEAESVSRTLLATLRERWGGEAGDGPADGGKMNGGGKVYWGVYVPAGYDAKQPCGVLAFIGSGSSGEVPLELEGVCGKQKLICVSPYSAENGVPAVWRHAMAAEGVNLIKKGFAIDKDRIYVAGVSGGARVASRAALIQPDLFAGGLYISGCDYIRMVYPEGTSGSWYMKFEAPEEFVGRAKSSSRFVLMAGDRDFNRGQTEMVAGLYKEDGFRYVTLQVVKGMKHGSPSAEDLEKAVGALDKGLADKSRLLFEEGERLRKQKRPGDALDCYRRALGHIAEELRPMVTDQRDILQGKYDAEVGAIERSIDAHSFAVAARAIRDLKETWGVIAVADADRLVEECRLARSGPVSRPGKGK